MITTINFHLIKACNFKCKFCYATFDDICSKGLSKKEQFELIKQLAETRYFKKINFAGGEPTLIPHLSELIKFAKESGFETSIVTNASKIDFNWIKNISSFLDILTVSIDSIITSTNLKSGRHQNGQMISEEMLENISKACKLFNVELKINTVVSAYNYSEILTPFVNKLKPFRWKILQATRVEGQNDTHFDSIKVSSNDFQNFCTLNRMDLLSEIKIIEESSNLIQGSYLMIDQLGRFYDSSDQKHNYSPKIMEVGVDEALRSINVDFEKFTKREGNYSVLSNLYK